MYWSGRRARCARRTADLGAAVPLLLLLTGLGRGLAGQRQPSCGLGGRRRAVGLGSAGHGGADGPAAAGGGWGAAAAGLQSWLLLWALPVPPRPWLGCGRLLKPPPFSSSARFSRPLALLLAEAATCGAGHPLLTGFLCSSKLLPPSAPPPARLQQLPARASLLRTPALPLSCRKRPGSSPPRRMSPACWHACWGWALGQGRAAAWTTPPMQRTWQIWASPQVRALIAKWVRAYEGGGWEVRLCMCARQVCFLPARGLRGARGRGSKLRRFPA